MLHQVEERDEWPFGRANDLNENRPATDEKKDLRRCKKNPFMEQKLPWDYDYHMRLI